MTKPRFELKRVMASPSAEDRSFEVRGIIWDNHRRREAFDGELVDLANEAWDRKDDKADRKDIRDHKEQASKIRGIKLRRERFMMSVRCFGMHLKGMTNKEIAARLNRTPQTVRGHIDRFIKPHKYIHHRRGVCQVNSRWYQYESFHEKQGF